MRAFFRYFSVVMLGIGSFHVMAFDVGERVKVKVLRKQNDNVITINRGIEDGVEKGDHVKFTNDAGFIARAIAVRSDMKISHWRLYRVMNGPALGENGGDLNLLSLSRDSAPEHQMLAADETEVIPTRETLVKDKGQNVLAPQSTDQILESLSAEQLQTDLSNYKVDLAIRQLQIGRVNDVKNISYGVNIANMEREKYNLDSYFTFATTGSTIPQTDYAPSRRTTSSMYNAGGNFKIRKFYKRFTYFSQVDFLRQRTDGYYPVAKRYSAGLTGIKYDFVDRVDWIREFDISYIPLLYSSVDNSPPMYNYTTGLEESTTTRTNFIRHSFRFRFMTHAVNGFGYEEQFKWKPYQGLDGKGMNARDCELENNMGINYTTGGHLTLGYLNTYLWDTGKAKKQNVPSSDMIHMLTMTFSFTI